MVPGDCGLLLFIRDRAVAHPKYIVDEENGSLILAAGFSRHFSFETYV